MKPSKDDILKGNALFVLQNALPLSIAGITYVWGMYDKNFDDALNASNSYTYYAEMSGPYWKTPKTEEELIKKSMLDEGLVKKIQTSIKNKRKGVLKITSKGSRYLQGLIKSGLKFKGKKELSEFKLRTIQYRKKKAVSAQNS